MAWRFLHHGHCSAVALRFGPRETLCQSENNSNAAWSCTALPNRLYGGMRQKILGPYLPPWALLILVELLSSSGCGSFQLGPWGGPAYDLQIDKVGTGEQAIVPTNDAAYWDGQPMDTRTRR